MMTVMAMFMGLIPIMRSTGTGADMMKRIAAPMIGGILNPHLRAGSPCIDAGDNDAVPEAVAGSKAPRDIRSQESTAVPISMREHGRMLVPVALNGKGTYLFLLDTGARPRSWVNEPRRARA
jgi:predicted aspartyl protease